MAEGFGVETNLSPWANEPDFDAALSEIKGARERGPNLEKGLTRAERRAATKMYLETLDGVAGVVRTLRRLYRGAVVRYFNNYADIRKQILEIKEESFARYNQQTPGTTDQTNVETGDEVTQLSLFSLFSEGDLLEWEMANLRLAELPPELRPAGYYADRTLEIDAEVLAPVSATVDRRDLTTYIPSGMRIDTIPCLLYTSPSPRDS